jgi:hypothetical protein
MREFLTEAEVKRCGYDPSRMGRLIDWWRVHSNPNYAVFMCWHLMPCDYSHDSIILKTVDLEDGRCVGESLFRNDTWVVT